jgi:pyruvate dehydrogenase E2 component (dihydrolipoamide acetyltransferase)
MDTEVIVPPLGQTIDVMTLVAWYKNEGETVTQGEMLFALETDKSTLDVEAPASGVLRQIRAKPGDEVHALSVIALIGPPESVSLGQGVTGGAVEQVLFRDADHVVAQAESPLQPLPPPSARLFISPRARRLAEAHGAPLKALFATGPEGAIIERDVRNYLERQAAAPAEELLELISLSSARTTIAKRMIESASTTAQVTLTTEADATLLVELRQQLRQEGTALSYNDLFIFILGLALRDYPQLNASLDVAQNTIKVWRHIHIGLAVDTERGLVVPVVRHVASKGLLQLAAETKALIERAQAGQCTPDELRGSTFTLTNLGMFGIDAFTPLLNLPECAILGVGRIKTQPVMLGDAVVGRQMIWLSLTFDHRLIDGGPAARFLQRVVQLVEHPPLGLAN